MSQPYLILLAAGESTRMGQPKGTLDYHGRPWLVEQLRRVSQAGVNQVVLVAASAANVYRQALAAAEMPESLEVIEALNPRPQEGIFSSLLCGLRTGSMDGRSAFVLPIDVPCPARSAFVQLTSALAPGVRAALPTFQRRGGHPVLLSPEFIAKLILIPRNLEARLDIQLHKLGPSEVKRVEVVDASVTMNLNTPEEWRLFAV